MDEKIFLHIKHLQQLNRRPRSIECRKRALLRLEKWCERHDKNILDVSYDDLIEFLDRPLSPQGRASEISHFRNFFLYCCDEEWIDKSPALKLVRPRVPRRLPRPMSDVDKHIAFEQSEGRIRAWLFLAAYAGLRACEIAPIRGEDILWEEKILIIREQKGGDQGTVTLHPVLIEELRKVYKSGWLFEKGSGYEGHITPNQLQRYANKYLHGLGIDSTFHSLRHWFGTNVYRSSKDIRITQEAMRHTSVVTTVLYTQIDKSEIAGVIAKLPNEEFAA